MFLSKTKRNALKKQGGSSQVVAYDDKLHTISENVRRRVEQANNPLLAQLSTKNNTTMAFSSNAPRFSQKQPDESETFLGPGYYEQRSGFQQAQERGRTAQGARARPGIQTSGPGLGKQAGGAQSHAALAVGSVNQKSQHLLGHAGRFPGSPEKKAVQEATPGPGHYSQENLSRWFKRSYNMNFSEV